MADLKHQNFIDWMKALGMFLIVFGHVVGDAHNLFNQITQPVYTKQLGVAFFVFIMGWSLANDSRARLRVAFNRIFVIYFYGILFALLLSLIFIFTKNDTNASNYLPFFLGVNVVFNNFPANPTTWYIGTYFHLIVFWYFFLQGREIGKGDLVVALIVENVIRCVLVASGRDFIAYMLLPNWLTLFTLGFFLHNKKDTTEKTAALPLLMLWLGLLALWVIIAGLADFDKSFPFRHLAWSNTGSMVITSLLTSMVYILNTLLFFNIARRLPGLRSISFFARNTLIIFIAHMPVIYEFSPTLYGLLEPVWLKKAVLIVTLYVGLAVFSEVVQRFVNVKVLRQKTWDLLNRASKIAIQTIR